METLRTAGSMLLLGIASFSVSAQDADVHVPQELQDWVPWVLHGEEYRNCPFFMNSEPKGESQHVCAWPGRLNLDVDSSGGRFSQRWQIYQDSWVILPGDTNNWPQNVTVGVDPITVIAWNGRPAIRLTTGRYTLSGRFVWQRQPAALPISPDTGLVQLNVDGRQIEFPEWENGNIWLGERRQQVQVEDRLELTVFRRITDGVPIRLETLVRLNVSGRSREEELGTALPDNFLPLALSSSLPARLEPDGTLHAQVRPGRWEITVRARATESIKSLAMTEVPAPWPVQEIWSYQSNDRLRITTPEGPEVVDPVQTEVPPQWRNLPAFRLVPGAVLEIRERSRGLAQQDGNQLTLNRQLWMDFDGGGMTARDTITGSMRRDWRMDMNLPFILMSARQHGENLLVTRAPDGSGTGVETRSPELALDALSRIEGGAMPATGWQQRFNNVETTLQLPPGHYLLGASGADEARGSWYDNWTLWSVFGVVLIAAAIGRMFHPALGVITLVMLAITYQETGAPVWSWLNLLIAVALADAAPIGRWKKFATRYRNISFALIVLLFLPFAAHQIRVTLFPQLENSIYLGELASELFGIAGDQLPADRMSRMRVDAPARTPTTLSEGRVLMEDEAEPQAKAVAKAALFAEQPQLFVTGSRLEANNALSQRIQDRYAPGALLQTGPGIPNWRWNSYSLVWRGPVEPDQELSLVVLSPWATLMWRIGGVLLNVLLLLALSRTCFGFLNRLPLPGAHLKSILPVVLLAVLFVPWGNVAGAQTPDREILNQLRYRLIEQPECVPKCAEVVSARVAATTDRLTINLEIHVAEHTAVPIPGSDKGFSPDVIFIDGATVNVIHRDGNGIRWIDLDQGVRQVRMTGALPPVASVQVEFPEKPHQISAGGRGWEFAGISNGNLATNTLEMIRVRADATAPNQLSMATERFPVFVRVYRQIALNLDWSITTTVDRIAPERGAFTIELPLLPEESVVTENIEVADGKVTAAMAGGQSRVSWQSVIPTSESLTLTAPEATSWTEVWTVAAGPMWRVEYEGIPVVTPRQINPRFWVPEFYPNPSEQLTISVARPEASEGRVIAFDSVAVHSTLGKRSSESTLTLNYRATRGGQHGIMLPEGAEVLDVAIDSRTVPLRPTDNRLEMPVAPGQHRVQIRWRSTEGMSTLQTSPAIDLNMPSSNISLSMNLPPDRWLLFASGPDLGPAILYWAELVVFVIIAILLGRTSQTPLRTRHWLFLGLGLSTFSWVALLIFAAWLFVMSWWKKYEPDLKPQQFNLVQLALGLFSVIAILGLVSAIPDGLLGTPDMRIESYSYGSGQLAWFQDQTGSALPLASVVSVPLIYYKAAMLLWALWLSFALLRWLPWAWQCYTAHGLWKGKMLSGKREAESGK